MEKINVGTIYFPLDCNIFNDPKILRMSNKFGYGSITIYLKVISWLYLEKGILNKSDYSLIADQLKCEVKLVKNVVEDFDLFIFDGEEFSSNRVIADMKKRLGNSKGGVKTQKNKKGE